MTHTGGTATSTHTLEQYTTRLEALGKSSLTIRQHRSSLNRFMKWLDDEGAAWGNMGLQAVEQATTMDIRNFRKWLTNNLKPSTARQTLGHLRSFFDFLIERGVSIDNPVEHIDTVIQVRTAPKWLDHNEQNALIRSVRKHGDLRELTIITTLLHTGLRVQELCDLKVDDVTISDRKGKLVVRKGKHNRRREVPLNIDARRILTQWLDERDSDSEFIFVSQRSDNMTTRAIQHIIEKYRKLTDLDNLTAHALRHTFCHELVQRKVALDIVARLAGHIKNDGTPNIQQTLAYTTPDEHDLQNAVDELSWIR